MKITNRVLSVLLAAILLLGALPLTVYADTVEDTAAGQASDLADTGADANLAATDAAYTLTENDVTFGRDSTSGLNTILEIKDTAKKYSNVIIPSKFGKNRVEALGDNLYKSNNYLVSIVIADTVENIGNDAFAFCYKLNSVTLPNNLRRIGDDAFWYCNGLTSITLPDTLTLMGSGAFRDCSSLTSIALPDALTDIGSNVFEGCSSLISVTLPDTLTYISSKMFYLCRSLSSINLPKSLTRINREAFAYCKIKSITLPENLEALGDSAFYYCGLESITLPSTLTEIGAKCFTGCKLHLSELHFSDYFYEIGKDAFDDDITLTFYGAYGSSVEDYAKEHDNITFIGHAAPPYTLTADDVEYEENETGITIKKIKKFCLEMVIPSTIDGKKVTKLSNADDVDHRQIIEKRSYLRRVVISAPVEWIGRAAFAACEELEEVVLPFSIKTIDFMAFAGCESLTTINLPTGITKLEYGCFEECYNLRSVIVRESVTFIGQYALGFGETQDNTYYVLPYFAIYGVKGTAAETYAIKNGITFIEIKPETCVITFDHNGGSGTMEPAKVLKESYYPVPECAFTPPAGAIFAGWSFDGALRQPGEMIRIDDDCTLVACWEEFCTVTFDPNGGSGEMEPVYVEKGSTYTLPDCTFTPPSGKVFDRWAVNGTISFGTITAITVKEDTVLEAIWKNAPSGSYAITGSVKSFLSDTDQTTVVLSKKSGDTYALKGLRTVTGKSGQYGFTGLSNGSYRLTVRKKNHVTREYNVTVLLGSKTQDVQINPIGDVDGNGKVQAADAMKAYQHAQGKADAQLSDYAFLCADVAPVGKANGKVQAADAMVIYQQAQGKHSLF